MNEHLPGTKVAERLLTRPEGATMPEIVQATGGTKYNLLKTLEARGYAIRKVKEGNTTRYFAKPPSAQFFEATVTTNGQVTIPKEVRHRLGVRSGHKIRFVVENSNRAIMMPVSKRLSELAGILPKSKRVVTLEEMDEAIARAADARYRRAIGDKKR